jgi:hypothetical protein
MDENRRAWMEKVKRYYLDEHAGKRHGYGESLQAGIFLYNLFGRKKIIESDIDSMGKHLIENIVREHERHNRKT